MIKITYFIDKLTGFVKYLTTYSSKEYEDYTEIEDGTFTITVEVDEVDLKQDYYFKESFKKLSQRPSNYHNWSLDLEAWIEPENYQQLLFNEAASKIKQERQQLLATTDWTDTVSASTRLENYNSWQLYRQQLRDITKQEGYPFNVIWPTQPV
jgi:hypothetical protein